ncbi:MAG TPA: molybdate ABC transporter substrate-binding protein [Acidimicrobiales bacterium]|nr:molybdate ABC transporter substrate-binding protein [Acidimicrobiales bacterium]
MSDPWRRRLVVALVPLLLGALAACGDGGTRDGQLLVAAASDLRPAFEELGRRHQEATGTSVTFTFGSSGLLARQIANGAPYDVFASADERFVDDVIAAGRGDAATKAHYAIGRIVVWTRPGADPAVAIEDLEDDDIARIAIANPDHAPYGRAAEQALGSAGVLDGVRDRLVYGENISDTQRLVQSGNADVGVIALSLALASPEGDHVMVPATLHEPLDQALVVTAGSARSEAGRAFAALVVSEEGREVLRRFGFGPPAVR